MRIYNYITSYLFILIIAFVALTPKLSKSEELQGIWQTQDKTTNIKFEACSGLICGKIISFETPLNPRTGQIWKDEKNPNRKLRERPLIGVSMISNLKPTKNGWIGMLYNPLDGNNYSGFLRLKSNNQLILSGCIFGGIICKSETWQKIK